MYPQTGHLFDEIHFSLFLGSPKKRCLLDSPRLKLVLSFTKHESILSLRICRIFVVPSDFRFGVYENEWHQKRQGFL